MYSRDTLKREPLVSRSSQILSGEQEEVGGGAISELAVPSFGQSPGTRVQHGEKGSISPNKFCPTNSAPIKGI